MDGAGDVRRDTGEGVSGCGGAADLPVTGGPAPVARSHDGADRPPGRAAAWGAGVRIRRVADRADLGAAARVRPSGAGVRAAVRRRVGAVVAGAVLAIPILIPVSVGVAWAAPGRVGILGQSPVTRAATPPTAGQQQQQQDGSQPQSQSAAQAAQQHAAQQAAQQQAAQQQAAQQQAAHSSRQHSSRQHSSRQHSSSRRHSNKRRSRRRWRPNIKRRWRPRRPRRRRGRRSWLRSRLRPSSARASSGPVGGARRGWSSCARRRSTRCRGAVWCSGWLGPGARCRQPRWTRQYRHRG